MANKRPNPNEAFPNPNLPRLCYIKNVVKNPRIIIGDYTYYDDVDGADQFEKHVTHFYDFIGDKLIIGKFCAIAKGVEFVMNGANHRMDCATTYPFQARTFGYLAFGLSDQRGKEGHRAIPARW